MPDYDPSRIPILDDIIKKKSSSRKDITSDVLDENPGSKTYAESVIQESPQGAPQDSTAEATSEQPFDDGYNSDENLDLFTAEQVLLSDTASSDKTTDDIDSDSFFEPHITGVNPLNSYKPDTSADEDSASHFCAIDDDIDEESIIIDVNTYDSGDISDTEESITDTSSGHSDIDDSTSNDNQYSLESEDEDFLSSQTEDQPEVFESALIDYHPEDVDPAIYTLEDVEGEAIENISNDHNSRQIEIVTSSPQTLQISLQPLVDDIIKQLMPDLEQQLRFLVRQALEDKLPEEIIPDEDPQV